MRDVRCGSETGGSLIPNGLQLADRAHARRVAAAAAAPENNVEPPIAIKLSNYFQRLYTTRLRE